MDTSKSEVFEQALFLMKCLANIAGEGYTFKDAWGENGRVYDIDTRIAKIKEQFDSDFWNKVFLLSDDEKRMLGFMKWSSEEKEMCIPAWIWACLPDYMPNGGNACGKMKKNLDGDTRFGCVWWRV